MSISIEKLKYRKDLIEQHNVDDIITTAKEHPCQRCGEMIPAKSKAFTLRIKEDQYETTDTGTKPLGSKWKSYYKHYPNCEEAKKREPKEEQVDLFKTQ